ncbi:hypothetical protein EW026_g2283 [Hermanssonia centrifuga]|uniref:Complex 1 LYR protein domain-containing protein n=1 Tax=Hermanssonia centrifuga TaxID=98765 RepID=A0A4S4KPT1_9APHY|nr:hypothetical protein EW026_g2283 [Hermanssonia centrifuga]
MASKTTRLRVLALYKELHRLGRDYPDPSYNFHGKLRGFFEKNKNLTDEEEIEKAIKLGEYIRNGKWLRTSFSHTYPHWQALTQRRNTGVILVTEIPAFEANVPR